MQQTAASFEVRSATPESVCRALATAFKPLPKAGGALVFCTGAIAQQLTELSALCAQLQLTCPVVFVSGPGVLTERGELTDISAATGMVWSANRCTLRCVEGDQDIGQEELSLLLSEPGDGTTPTLLFVRSEGFAPENLWRVRARGGPRLFGAGTYGVPGMAWAEAGESGLASALCLSFARDRVPRIETAHACRLLGPPLPITRCSGALVEELAGRPALDVLSELGSRQSGQPLLFTVLANESPRMSTGFECLVRGIQGIDPDKKALLISEEVQPQQLLTFAAHDAVASREEMRAACLRLTRDAGGIVSHFGLFFNCAGRQRRPDGQPEADLRHIRERFPNLPIAGFHSAFEIAPFAGAPALQLYTGVVALVGSPN